MTCIRYYLRGLPDPVLTRWVTAFHRPDVEAAILSMLRARYGSGLTEIEPRGCWSYRVTLSGSLAGTVRVTFHSNRVDRW